MKTRLAVVLVVVGLALIVGSRFVGNRVSAEQEWSDQKVEQFERIAASVHSPATDRKTLENRDKLEVMQQELIDLKNAALAKKRLFYRSGVTTCVMGILMALWVRVERESV
jgi:hypothetical protein